MLRRLSNELTRINLEDVYSFPHNITYPTRYSGHISKLQYLCNTVRGNEES